MLYRLSKNLTRDGDQPREDPAHKITVEANVRGRDLASAVAVDLPPGWFVE